MKNLSKENDPEFTQLQMKAGTVTAALILMGLTACILGFLYMVIH